MTVRAAFYLRISQDATGEQAGVNRQREDCLALVESQGWQLHDVYVDNDISASSGAPRPGYRRMLSEIGDGVIDAVVAWHPDRLYRKITTLEEIIAACEARNVIMRTVRAGEIDLSTPTGRMVARIISATAQGEGEVKADRWKRSWRQGREAGRFPRTGSRLFGYTREGEVIEHEREIALRMVADVLEGASLWGISAWLEREGIQSTRGGTWRNNAVRQYLLNPRIAGWSTLKGEIVGEGDWEPLVDRQQWEGVRALIGSRMGGSRPARVSLLNGLIHCGECGTKLITSRARERRTYRCARRPGIDGCNLISIDAVGVEEVVEGYVKAKLEDARVQQRVADLRADPGGRQAELADLEMRVHELEQQLDEPGVPVATLLRAIERARERQEVLVREVASAHVATLPVSNVEWPEDLRKRRALVDLVVADVKIARATAGGKFRPERVTIEPR